MRRAYMKSAGLTGARQYERAILLIARQHSMVNRGVLILRTGGSRSGS